MIELPKFKEKDYQFHTEVASTGYKKYFLKGDLVNPFAELFEAKLSKRIQQNVKMFTKTERLSLLEQQVRTIINMVPQDLKTYRNYLDCVEGQTFEFFMPLEMLKG